MDFQFAPFARVPARGERERGARRRTRCVAEKGGDDADMPVFALRSAVEFLCKFNSLPQLGFCGKALERNGKGLSLDGNRLCNDWNT